MENPIDQTAAKNMKKLCFYVMETEGLTCLEMAEIMGCSQSNVKRLRLSGELSYVKPSMIYLLAKRYGIPLEILFTKEITKEEYLRYKNSH